MRLLLLITQLAVNFVVQGQILPQQDANQHLGPASCATSVCHGKVVPDETSNVWLNEYRVWSREDRHARAYQTLSSARSKSIATKLGLPDAHTAKACLDCHSDNVARHARGSRFQISDGVSCEACHGGAGNWISTHTEKSMSHSDNLAAGMYPTADVMARAELCLSCHLGSDSKFVNHKMLGAGHPRLMFDLQVFSINQPAHYNVDTDYEVRKKSISSVDLWIYGLLISATQSIELIRSSFYPDNSLQPEFALFECHSCHHAMDEQRWSRLAIEGDVSPGTLRLNDANVQLLALILTSIKHPDAPALTPAIKVMHAATWQAQVDLERANQKLLSLLSSVQDSLIAKKYTRQEMQAMRLSLLRAANRGEFRDYTSAEQSFLGIETLSIEIGDEPQLSQWLDAMHKILEDEDRFSPQDYVAITAEALRQLQ